MKVSRGSLLHRRTMHTLLQYCTCFTVPVRRFALNNYFSSFSSHTHSQIASGGSKSSHYVKRQLDLPSFMEQLFL